MQASEKRQRISHLVLELPLRNFRDTTMSWHYNALWFKYVSITRVFLLFRLRLHSHLLLLFSFPFSSEPSSGQREEWLVQEKIKKRKVDTKHGTVFVSTYCDIKILPEVGWPGCRGTPSCRPPWSPSVTSFYSEALSILSVKSHYCNCKDSQDIMIWEGYVFGRQSTLNYNCHSPNKEQENPNKNGEWQHPSLRAEKDNIRDNSQEKVLTMSQYTMSVVTRLSTNNSSLFSNKLTTFKILVLFGKQHKCIPKGTLKSAC